MRHPTTRWVVGSRPALPLSTCDSCASSDPVDGHVAADSQSADRSGSLQLPLLFLKAGLRAAACGGRPRPAGSR
jgi:hypothetical protein